MLFHLISDRRKNAHMSLTVSDSQLRPEAAVLLCCTRMTVDTQQAKKIKDLDCCGSTVRVQPITYKVGGRQYVAIPSGAGGLAVTVVGENTQISKGSALVVFALPE